MRKKVSNKWGCYYFLFEKKIVKLLSNSPSHRQIKAPVINIRPTLRTAPVLCTNVSLTVLFGSEGNSYAMSTQVDTCMYPRVLHNTDTLVGQKK